MIDFDERDAKDREGKFEMMDLAKKFFEMADKDHLMTAEVRLHLNWQQMNDLSQVMSKWNMKCPKEKDHE